MAKLIPIERFKPAPSTTGPIPDEKPVSLVPIDDDKERKPRKTIQPIDFSSIRQMRQLDPSDPAVAEIAERNQTAITLFDRTKEQFRADGGDEAAEMFDKITISTNQMPKSLDQFTKQRAADASIPLSEDIKDFVNDFPRLGEIAVESGSDAIVKTLKGAAKLHQNLQPHLQQDPLMRNLGIKQRTPEENMDAILQDGKSLVEGGSRNLLGLKNLGQNILGGVIDEFNSHEEEIHREWVRGLENQAFQINVGNGIIYDPDDLDPDVLFFSEMAADPINLVSFGGGKLVTAGPKIFRPIGKIPTLNRSIARNVIRKGPVFLGQGVNKFKTVGGSVKDFVLTKSPINREKITEFIEDLAAKNPNKAKAIKKNVQDVKTGFNIGTGGVPNFLVATIKDLPENLKGIGEFREKVARQLSQPEQRRRLLSRLAVQEDSKFAAIAEKFGGTEVGDVLFNAVVDNVPPATLNSLIVLAQGGSQEDAARAFGETAGFLLLGEPIKDRGAGATREQRVQGSFEQARNERFTQAGDPRQRLQALGDIYQKDNFNKMPDEYKEIIGIGNELNILPKNVLYLAGDDFNAAARSLQNPDVRNNTSVTRYDNGALYFPGQDVLLLNSDSKLTGRAAMSLIGEELSHSAMARLVQQDPSFMLRQARVFGDPKGREMPFQLSEEVGNAPLKNIKINAELAKFVDDYNVQAEASGAPQINDFSRAIDEFFASEASTLFTTGSDELFKRTANPVKNVVAGMRKKMLELVGVNVGSRNRQQQINKIKDQGLKTYAREQLGQFIKERQKIDNSITERYKSRENIKVPEGEGVVDFSAEVIQSNPNVVTVETVAKPLDSANAKSKQVKTKRLGKSFKKQFEETVDRDALTNQDVMRKSQTARGGIQRTGKRLGEDTASLYLSTFNKGFREDAAGMLNGLQGAIDNGQAINGTFRTRKGINQGTIENRTFLPVGWQFSGTPGNLKLAIRDVDAIDNNVSILVDNGLSGGRSKSELKNHIMNEVRKSNETGSVPDDVTKVIFRDESKQAGIITDPDLNDFILNDRKRGAKKRLLQATFKTPDFEGVIGFGALPGMNSPMSFGWEANQFKFTPFVANPLPVSKQGKVKLDEARKEIESGGTGPQVPSPAQTPQL